MTAAATSLADETFEQLGPGMDRLLLGLRLRELREAAGITQAGLAEILDEPQANVSRWERGKMEIPGAQIPEICKAIRCRVTDFFTPPTTELAPRQRGRPPKPQPPPAPPAKRARRPGRDRGDA